ncbi:G2 and S phase-expressed protein 1 [Discoglossus pictus]
MDNGGEFSLLADEKFDFDISLSPTSGKEDCDDEVFIGPVRHKEKCVSVALKSPESEEQTPPHVNDQHAWSPLSGDKFVEIFKEAHLLAMQLECFSTEDQKKEEPVKTVKNIAVERFVQESKSKLNLFDTVNNLNKTPVAIKRETYCVQDSPFSQLPPSVQQRFAAASTNGGRESVSESPKAMSPNRMLKCAKEQTASPLAQKTKAPPLKKAVLGGNPEKTTLSRLQPGKLPSAQAKNRLTIEKPKAARKIGLATRKPDNSAGSTEDLLSDKSSITSDVSDSSFNNSIVGQSKRTLQPPNKIGLKKTQFKQPATGVPCRRNTTSSSSSSHSSVNSSLNSSLSVSPAGKLNSSLNTSINGSRLQTKSNPSRFALVRPTAGSTSSLKNNSTNTPSSIIKPSTTAKVLASGNRNPTSSVSIVNPQTPAGKLQKQISAPNLHRLSMQSKTESAIKALPCTKPQARIMPTPTNRLKLQQKPGGVSPEHSVGKTLQPTKLLSCSEIGSGIAASTPMKPTQGVLPNPNFSARSISATPNTKRLSGLPTPMSRRTVPAIPTTTPKTLPRTISALRPSMGLQASNILTRKPLASGTSEPEGNIAKVIESSSGDDDVAVLPCSLNFSPEEKTSFVANNELEILPVFPQSTEVLLIDIGVEPADIRKPSWTGSDNSPLIDLSNTPELHKKMVPLKPTQVGQLIDFSSPLIKLSPMVNKENMGLDSPLLKF